MAKKMEENFDLDLDNEMPLKEVAKVEPKKSRRVKEEEVFNETETVNCLRNERVIVRHIPKQSGMVTNPRHILYGGMAENATKTFVVPRLSSGMYVDVLTKSEKAFLEDLMGLEYNALSIYRKNDNYWDDTNENSISKVRLTKQDNILNLADPEDYIRYKILLANKNFIAPSIQALQDAPKASYQFVIIEEGEESKTATSKMNTKMQCYTEFGAIKEDTDKLRVIIETLTGRPTSVNSKLDFLQAKIDELIQADSKLFLRVIKDDMLGTKVLIKNSIEAGLISKRGDYYYLRSDGSQLCEINEEPTLSVACKYLNSPKHQEVKLSLEAKLKL